MKIADKIKKEIRSLGTAERAKASIWFFKTGKGQYGEGDVFLGLTMGEQRNIAKKYMDLPLSEIESLLHSKEHEFRMVALLILVLLFKGSDKLSNKKDSNKMQSKVRREIYNFYLKNTKWINNWDLVDVSAHHIVGGYLDNLPTKIAEKEKMRILTKLAYSKSLWERRIAVISTFAFIKKGRHEEALVIAEILLGDKHDLIHKAVGWMLREVGKKTSPAILKNFLQKNIKQMPRTMLRYAIERFEENERKKYLKMI